MIVQWKGGKLVGNMTACRSILLTPIFFYNNFVMPPNGPELSCGDVQRRRGSYSARGMSSPIAAGCFARAKSSTAGSVSLSDWLASAG